MMVATNGPVMISLEFGWISGKGKIVELGIKTLAIWSMIWLMVTY